MSNNLINSTSYTFYLINFDEINNIIYVNYLNLNQC